MARTKSITLETQIAEAQAALNDAPDEQRPAIEAQIAQKSADLQALRQQQQTAYASEQEELIALRKREHDRELGDLADRMAAQAISSIKSQQEDEESRISAMVAERVQAQVAQLLSGTQFASAVKSAMPPVPYGRKTPPVVTEDQGEITRSFSIARKGAGLIDFMRAVANKDGAAVREIQRAHGMKALTEGAGAGSAGSIGAGGALVPPEYSTQIIDILRAAAVLRRAGPEIVTMTSPQYFRPRLATASSASYIGETVAIAPSAESFSQVTLNAKKLAAIVPVSNELLRDSNPGVEEVVRNDLVKVLALKEDIQFLNGVGSAVAPTGLFTRADIQTIAPGTNGDALTYKTPLAMWTKLTLANVMLQRPAWFCNPVLIQTLLSVVDANGRPIFTNFFDVQKASLRPDQQQIGMAGTLFGAPVYTTTQIPVGTTGTGATTPLALIEMSEVLIGQMAELVLDTSNEASYYDGSNTISLWQADLTGFRAILRHDCTMMQGSAVVVYNGLVY